MFEDSTFESNGRIRTRSRNWSLAAFALNGAILAALVVFPLIHPEALPQHWMTTLITAPPPPAEVKPVPVEPRQTVFHGRPELTPLGLTIPTKIPHGIAKYDEPERVDHDSFALTGVPGGTQFPEGDPFHNAAPHPAVVVKPQGPAHISSGVATGLLVQKTMPIYPPIARAAHVEGVVVLQAIISRSGRVEQLQVVSGHPMLQQAARDAVSTWLYRPYLLNGEPVDVETTINVVFSLSR